MAGEGEGEGEEGDEGEGEEEGMRPDVLTSPMCLHYLHDGGASRWSGIFFRSGQRYSFFIILLRLFLPSTSPFFQGGWMVFGGSKSSYCSVWDSRLVFPFYCCAVLGFAEYPCFDPGVWALKWADVDCLAAFHVYGEEGGGSGEGALCGTATHATLDGLVVN